MRTKDAQLAIQHLNSNLRDRDERRFVETHLGKRSKSDDVDELGVTEALGCGSESGPFSSEPLDGKRSGL